MEYKINYLKVQPDTDTQCTQPLTTTYRTINERRITVSIKQKVTSITIVTTYHSSNDKGQPNCRIHTPYLIPSYSTTNYSLN